MLTIAKLFISYVNLIFVPASERLSVGEDIPAEFSPPGVVEISREFYAGQS